MTRDALAPGPLNNFPAFPRTSTGEPAWSDRPEDDNTGVLGPDGQIRARMPRGVRHIIRRSAFGERERIAVDVTPRHPNGTPIVPPKLP